jgi:hypothetical protein
MAFHRRWLIFYYDGNANKAVVVEDRASETAYGTTEPPHHPDMFENPDGSVGNEEPLINGTVELPLMQTGDNCIFVWVDGVNAEDDVPVREIMHDESTHD